MTFLLMALWLALTVLGGYWVRLEPLGGSLLTWTVLLIALSVVTHVLAATVIADRGQLGRGKRPLLHAWAQLQFFAWGAAIVAVPAYLLSQDPKMTLSLLLAAVMAIWLVCYQKQWAQGFFFSYARSSRQRLYSLHGELNRAYEQNAATRAKLQFFWSGLISNLASAVALLWLLLCLMRPDLANLRNWLAFSLMIVPGCAFLARECFANAAFDLNELHSRETRAENPSVSSLAAMFSASAAEGPFADSDSPPSDRLVLNTDTGEYLLPSMRAQDSREFDLSHAQIGAAHGLSGVPQFLTNAEPTGGMSANAPPVQNRMAASVSEFQSQATAQQSTSVHAIQDQQLKKAVLACDALAAQTALQLGANVNVLPHDRDADQRTLLSIAAAAGQLKLVKLLLAHGADVNLAHRGLNPLLMATRDSWTGRFDVVMALLSNGADAKVADAQGQTPMHGAARSTDVALLQALADASALVDQQDIFGVTPLICAVQANRLANVLWFLKAGAKPEPIGGLPMALAAAMIHEPDPKLLELITQRADLKSKDERGYRALHMAALEDADSYLERLLSVDVPIDALCNRGQTALMLAARSGHIRLVQRLLDAKADPRLQDQDGNSVLHLAVSAPHSQIALVEQLRDAGAPLELRNQSGQTAAELALKLGRWELAKSLSRERELPEALQEALQEALAHGASNSPKPIVEPLAQAPVADTDHSRAAMIVQACAQRRMPVVQMLMKLGAIDPHYQQKALLALGDELSEIWLDALAPITGVDQPEPILTQMARQIPTPQQAMKLLIQRGASVTPDAEGDTALLLLCGAAAELEGLSAPLVEYPDPDLVQMLLSAKIELTRQDGEGRNALSYAVQWCHADTVRLLLESPSALDPNERDRSGQTPLLRAMDVQARDEVDGLAKITALLRAGADPHLLGRDGRSARAIALASGQQELAQLLAWPERSHPGRALEGADLPTAASKGDLESVKRLLQLGMDIEAIDAKGYSALAHAVGRGDRAMLEYLHARGARPGGLPDLEPDMSPLGAAVNGRHFDLIRRLVSLGAPIDQRFGELTALSLACARLDQDCQTLLLELGASATLNRNSRFPILSPWHAVLQAVLNAGDLTQAEGLWKVLLKAGVDPDEPDSSGRSAVFVLLSGNQSKQIFEESERLLATLRSLLTLGCNVLARDSHGRSALHWCCRHGLFASAEVLLDFGADPQAVDEFRKLPVDMATTLNRHDFIALFRA